jgi:hypothetical protein
MDTLYKKEHTHRLTFQSCFRLTDGHWAGFYWASHIYSIYFEEKVNYYETRCSYTFILLAHCFYIVLQYYSAIISRRDQNAKINDCVGNGG